MKLKKILASLITFLMILQNLSTIVLAVETDMTDKNEAEISETQTNQKDTKVSNYTEKEETKEKNEEKEESEEKVKVDFKDANFEKYMQDHFDFDEDGIITDSDMQKIENFEIYDTYNIKNFNGIEKAINIKKVSIYNFNNINLTAIFELSNVESLELHGSDYNISGIEKLTKLETLELYQNSSNSYIAGLNSIKELDLKSFSIDMNDNIFDLSLISSMTSLQDLSIDGKISNQNMLWNYTQLKKLIISARTKIDFDGIQNLKNLEYLEIGDNYSTITQDFDINLVSEMTKLQYLSLNNTNIINLDCLKNLTNLQRLNLRKNKITNISALANLKNLNYLDLRNNPININAEENKKVYDMIIQNGGQVEVDEYDDSEIIEIPDVKLKERLIKYDSIDSNNDGEISKHEMENLKSVYVSDNVIKSLEGLQYAINLESISFDYCNMNISFEPLYDLTKLKEISISTYNGEVFDISILNNFKYIESLYIYGRIRNQETLWNYTQLKKLTIKASYSMSFDGIQNLKNLEYLEIGNNYDTILEFDLNLIYDMINIKDLSIINVNIKEIGALANLTNLQKLNLTKNKITNISELVSLTNLKYLNIQNNPININSEENKKVYDMIIQNGGQVEVDEYDDSEIIEIPDSALLRNLLNNIDKNNDNKISKKELENLQTIGIYDYLNSLEGLQYAINLEQLSLSYNAAEGYIPLDTLYNLPKLKKIEISTYGNNKTEGFDISTLNNLKNIEDITINGKVINQEILWTYTQLKKLKLRIDERIDFNGIQNLNKLEYLDISSTSLDLSLIANLDSIQYLSISNANIDDLDFLANLTNLQKLYLNRNKITNISALANLKNLNYLDLRNNPIDINSEENKKVYDMIIQDGGQVEVDEYDNSEIIEIQDEELKESLIKDNSIDTNNDGEISKKELESIKSIYIGTNYNIKSFEGLQYAKNLTRFSISYNSDNTGISFEPLYNLTELKELSVSAYTSEGFDASILNNFKYLENLDLNGSVKNQNLIWNLTQLKRLTIYGAYYNWDFNGLQNLNNLEYLYITNGSNRIFDLNLIANMTKLQNLSISGQIANQQVLNNLQQITSLSLTNAYIVNLDFLTNLTNLQRLNLTKNKITNITGLEKLKNLNYLELRSNPININTEENKKVYDELIRNNVQIQIDKYDESEIITIPDGTLKKRLIDSGIDNNNDDEISVKEIENLQTLSVYGDVKSLEGLQYAVNLKELSLSGNNTNSSISLQPIYNLSNLKKLTLYNGIFGEENLDFLKGLTSLTELGISNMNKEIDLTELAKYPNIISFSISGSEKIKNLESLTKLPNLKKLYISKYDTNGIDVECLKDLRQVEELTISGNIKNQKVLWNITQLKKLTFSTNYNPDNTIDFDGIQNLKDLEYLEFSGNICNISNLEQIDKLESLKTLKINYNSYSYNNLDDKTKRETEIIDMLEKFKYPQIILSYSGMSVDLKGVECGKTKTIKLEDISPIYKAYLNKNSKLYCREFTIKKYDYDQNNNIIVDDENKTITIKADNEIKKEYANISFSIKYADNNMSGGSINFSWQSYKLVDSQKEINIPDQNLKQLLLEKYDVDADQKITETDMINLLELQAGYRKIKSLEGLQNAINLYSIQMDCNEITDITPILKLEKLDYINFYSNFISDITCLKNAKFLDNIEYDECLQFENNFIDFTLNNENYKILKELLYKNIKDGKKSLIFEHTVNCQKNGRIENINKVVNLDVNLKKKLIELGLDSNNDGNITRKELYTAYDIMDNEIDLSNSNISNISGLEYLNPSSINLSNNNISDISGIEKWNQLTSVDLSYNKISNIAPISNLFYMIEDGRNYAWDYWDIHTEIDLSHNKISDITCVAKWKNIGNLNLSYNMISDIAVLNDYIYIEDTFEGQKNIDLSNNYINLENQNNLAAKEYFEKNKNPLLLDNQKSLSDIAGFEVSKKYDKNTNKVTVTITSKSELQATKPTWKLSDDKLQYSKEYDRNGEYTTTIIDVNGYSETISFNITEIESGFNLLKEYDAKTNTVLVRVTSKCVLEATKPTWTLSEDKLIYSKRYDENGKYSTTFTDINGNVENVIFTINEIDQTGPELEIKIQYDEKTNTVIVNTISNEILGQTKPTWTLSENKLCYSKIYGENGTYTTTFSDIYGNTTKVTFEVTEIKSGYEVYTSYNKETNTVKVDVKSKCKLQATKPTWKLSEDGYTYSKDYYSNGTYTTIFVDTNNKTEKVTFEITSIDDKAPEIEIRKEYNEERNTVTIKAISNEKLGNTKPTWILSNDKLVYSKEYNANAEFTTTFSDIYGNTTNVTFIITEIKSGYEVSQSYDDKLNTAKVIVKSNCKFQNTKPSWMLSEDGYTYSKEYSKNGTYKTSFTDTNGKTEEVTFEVTLIDEEGPQINIVKEYDEKTNTVLVKAISNEKLGETKPSWELSEDRLVYSKRYALNGTYSTLFRDQYGNESNVVFEIEEIKSGFEISKIYDDKTNKVIITVKSVCELQETKPTWILSEDRYSYSKIYEENGTYTTTFTDLNGEIENIKFDITEIDMEGPQISIETQYDEKTNTVIVNAVSNEVLGETKPTWTLSDDKMIYSKKYNVNGIYTTVFSDQYGNTSQVTFKVSEIK